MKASIIDWTLVAICSVVLTLMIWGGMPAHHTTASDMARNPAVSGW